MFYRKTHPTASLGVIVQADLKWDAHVRNMISRANRKLYILKALKRFFLPINDLVSIYLGYIRPLLEYATPVWNFSLTIKQVKALENFQKRVCKIILGNAYKGYCDALVSCGLVGLSQRRKQLCIKFGQSLLTSKHFSSWIPLTRHQSHGRLLRNSSTLTIPFCRTRRYQNSPLVALIKLLNSVSY